MTRLTEKDIAGLDEALAVYDQELIGKTGMTLAEVACLGAGISGRTFAQAAEDLLVAVVPITAGLGVIGGFTSSVESIVRFLGFRSLITAATDVAGLYEAITSGADLVFLADDQRFICLNLHSGLAAENGIATGRGFAAALHNLAGGLEDQGVLVLGAGPVGRAAIEFLLEIGARVAVFDPDGEKIKSLSDLPELTLESDLAESLPRYRYLLDASPQAGFLTMVNLHPEAFLACPGVPLGVDDAARVNFQQRIVHDPLQIGVATMLAMACRRPVAAG